MDGDAGMKSGQCSEEGSLLQAHVLQGVLIEFAGQIMLKRKHRDPNKGHSNPNGRHLDVRYSDARLNLIL